MTAADLFDQFIFQGHEHARVQYLHALHSTHLLAADVVLEA